MRYSEKRYIGWLFQDLGFGDTKPPITNVLKNQRP
jgi:hypothetical protein